MFNKFNKNMKNINNNVNNVNNNQYDYLQFIKIDNKYIDKVNKLKKKQYDFKIRNIVYNMIDIKSIVNQILIQYKIKFEKLQYDVNDNDLFYDLFYLIYDKYTSLFKSYFLFDKFYDYNIYDYINIDKFNNHIDYILNDSYGFDKIEIIQ